MAARWSNISMLVIAKSIGTARERSPPPGPVKRPTKTANPSRLRWSRPKITAPTSGSKRANARSRRIDHSIDVPEAAEAVHEPADRVFWVRDPQLRHPAGFGQGITQPLQQPRLGSELVVDCRPGRVEDPATAFVDTVLAQSELIGSGAHAD